MLCVVTFDRRKSSSIIEDLPSDFLSRLQASSSQSRQEGSKDLEEEKEEQEEPDESTSKDPVMRDYDNKVLETELSSDVLDCSSCSQIRFVTLLSDALQLLLLLYYYSTARTLQNPIGEST